MLLEERKLNISNKIKKSIIAAKKCKIIFLQAALKDFSSSAHLKLKKLSKNSHFLRIIYAEKKYARMGVLGGYFSLQVI